MNFYREEAKHFKMLEIILSSSLKTLKMRKIHRFLLYVLGSFGAYITSFWLPSDFGYIARVDCLVHTDLYREVSLFFCLRAFLQSYTGASSAYTATALDGRRLKCL